jgi:5-methylcytosine-specific restriction endonuclease McrA
MKPSKKIRNIVVKRAGDYCEYCFSNQVFSTSPFSIDHIIPTAKEGTNDLENLCFACQGCNT